MLRRVVYCLGVYMQFRRVILMFRKVVYCSGGLYAVQEDYMDVQEGYIMLKKIMVKGSKLNIYTAERGINTKNMSPRTRKQPNLSLNLLFLANSPLTICLAT